MALKNHPTPADCTAPLYINGLRGRVLYLPPKGKKRRQMLLIYGRHSGLERMFGLAEELNRYGGVTVPDLPGFGGMDSFYRIGERPTLDNMTDYLAAFVKLRYKRRRVSVLAISYGFLVVTRMLQRYPELVGKVDLLISLAGFAHYDDFKYSKNRRRLHRLASAVFSRRPPAWLLRFCLLRPTIIRAVYARQADRQSQSLKADQAECSRWVDSKIELWRVNDARTHMYTMYSMLTVDLCDAVVNLPVYHIAVADDRWLDNRQAEKRLGIIFTKVHPVAASATVPLPPVTASLDGLTIPTAIRRLLARA